MDHFLYSAVNSDINHTDLRFLTTSYTKSLDLMNKVKHADFDHCIKKLTIASPLKLISSNLMHPYCSRNAVLDKFYKKKKKKKKKKVFIC